MLGLLGFILIFVLFVVLIGFALIGNILRFLFGLGKRTPKPFTNQQFNQSDNTHHSTTPSNSTNKKKIFGDDEGEYVEFEEM